MCSRTHLQLEMAGEDRGETRDKTVTQKESGPVLTEQGMAAACNNLFYALYLVSCKTLNMK